MRKIFGNSIGLSQSVQVETAYKIQNVIQVVVLITWYYKLLAPTMLFQYVTNPSSKLLLKYCGFLKHRSFPEVPTINANMIQLMSRISYTVLADKIY